MITLVKTTNRELFLTAMRAAFYDDQDLKIYHIKPSDDYEEMVLHSYENIGIVRGQLGADLYVVYKDEEIIGFTVIAVKAALLYSFGININHRNKYVLSQWLKICQNKLFDACGFVNVLLYSKNTRALGFFERNGFATTFNNKKIMDSDPATMMTKYKSHKMFRVVDELEFEEGLG
jgi:hypothetical protein